MDSYIKIMSKFLESTESREEWAEMFSWYRKRTMAHIRRVEDFMDASCEFYPSLDLKLRNRGKVHDASKFKKPEMIPYVHLTWKYKMISDGHKDYDIEGDMSRRIHDMTFHHIKNNPHHPEYWDKGLRENPINFEDRDKPSGIIVDGSSMDDLSLIEMVCDWSAMSVEKGNAGGPKAWADMNVGKRWSFSDSQTDLIYETIELLW